MAATLTIPLEHILPLYEAISSRSEPAFTVLSDEPDPITLFASKTPAAARQALALPTALPARKLEEATVVTLEGDSVEGGAIQAILTLVARYPSRRLCLQLSGPGIPPLWVSTESNISSDTTTPKPTQYPRLQRDSGCHQQVETGQSGVEEQDKEEDEYGDGEEEFEREVEALITSTATTPSGGRGAGADEQGEAEESVMVTTMTNRIRTRLRRREKVRQEEEEATRTATKRPSAGRDGARPTKRVALERPAAVESPPVDQRLGEMSLHTRATRWLEETLASDHLPQIQGTKEGTVQRMVATALGVAGPETIGKWWDIVEYWRKTGELVSTAEGLVSRPGSQDGPRSPWHDQQGPLRHAQSDHRRATDMAPARASSQPVLSQTKRSVLDFCSAYRRNQFQDMIATLQPVLQRYSQVVLSSRYDAALSDILSSTQSQLVHSPKRTEAKVELFYACYPEYAHVIDPVKNRATSGHWKTFSRTLEQAARMRTLERELGKGIFTILPDSFTNRFLTNILCVGHIPIWAGLVRRFNPRYRDVETNATRLLSHGLAGKPLAVGRRLAMERIPREQAVRHESPGLLFEAADPTVVSEGGTPVLDDVRTLVRNSVGVEVVEEPGFWAADGDTSMDFSSFFNE